MPPPASKSFQGLRTPLPQPTALGAEPTDTPLQYAHTYMECWTRGPGLELYPTPERVWGTDFHFPTPASPNPPPARLHDLLPSLSVDEQGCPQGQRKRQDWSPRSPILASPPGRVEGGPSSPVPIIHLGAHLSSSSGRMEGSYLMPLPFCQSQPTLTPCAFHSLQLAASQPSALRQRSGGRTKAQAGAKVALGGAQVGVSQSLLLEQRGWGLPFNPLQSARPPETHSTPSL